MLISRQRERISSNLTALMKEHKKSSQSSWNRGEKLLGVSNSPQLLNQDDALQEFVEEDVWAVEDRDQNNRILDRFLTNYAPSHYAHESAPMNVPDWCKILRKKSNCSRISEEDVLELPEDEWVPPHILTERQDAARLQRSSMFAFSVLEGAGRTLKGSDLKRVRNAVWMQTGYLVAC